uniref:Retrotransposon gag domain-containing protein n=1 Tax=Ananas comosus var. bracteatus TaxID=296719 RepID=A0A6V7NH15_ANACO|nr:unnamed protein product [Ananas comosus var. bracteatus]
MSVSWRLCTGTAIASYTGEILLYMAGMLACPERRGNPGRDRLSWYQSLVLAMYQCRGRPSTRDCSAPAEMPEQAGPSAPPDLREQLAALTEVTRQQRALLQRMCETFTPPPSTAPRAPEQSAPPPTIPVAAPATAISPPVTVPSAPVAFSGEASQMSEADCTEPWVVEGWVSAMEKLVDDLFIPEREQIHLGVHCLAGDAHSWWKRIRDTRRLVALKMMWDEFCGMLYEAYFPNSVKQKLEEDLKKLQQGSDQFRSIPVSYEKNYPVS